MRDPHWPEILTLNPFLPNSHPRSLVRVIGVHGRDFPYDWRLEQEEPHPPPRTR